MSVAVADPVPDLPEWYRYQVAERYTPSIGPHTSHRIKVLLVKDLGNGYDRIRVACPKCRKSWVFIHHWNWSRA